MRSVIIAVPYDAGRPGVGVGLGPERLLEAGVVGHLRAAGHAVREATVEIPPDTAHHELARIVATERMLAAEMAQARERDELPIVLAGNCSTAVGTLSGRPSETAVVWFDAHADFNTAETTTTGMVDGLALSMVTGRALRALTASVPGFVAVDDGRVILVGARDLDPPEELALAAARVQRIAAGDAPSAVGDALRAFGKPAPPVYIHLDLDVVDPAHARANQYGAPGGLTPAGLIRTLAEIVAASPVYALAITAYDPAWDRDGRMRQVALEAIDAVVSRRSRQP